MLLRIRSTACVNIRIRAVCGIHWWMMDSYLEASATCGFAYGILKAVGEGLVDKSYLEAVRKAARPVMNCISEDGVVHQVSYGTPMGRTTKDFYKGIELKPMPYGQALAILFLMEYRKIV